MRIQTMLSILLLIACSVIAQNVTEFTVPPGSGPETIAAAPDGSIWFTDNKSSKIERIQPWGEIKEFPLAAGRSPAGIAVGPSGDDVWFAEEGANEIARMTFGGEVTEVSLGPDHQPFAITVGPDGNLWFTEPTANRIGSISTTGVIRQFDIPTASSSPVTIAAGPDGNLWFTEGIGRIGRITTSGTFLPELNLPLPSGPSSQPLGITAGSDGKMWFTEATASKIGSVTMGGEIQETALPVTLAFPAGIVATSNGTIWFAAALVNRIGKITPDGQIVSIDVAQGAEPLALVEGPEHNIWFTEYAGDKVGRVEVALTINRVTPSSGTVGSMIEISGTEFSSGATVTIGGMAATATVNSSDSITAVVPVLGAGAVDITVSQDNASAVMRAAFVVTGPPVQRRRAARH